MKFLLNFGQQSYFATKARCARDPVAFRQHSDHLGVSMLGDLADKRLSVSFRHPILRFDLHFLVYLYLKLFFQKLLVHTVEFGWLRKYKAICGGKNSPITGEPLQIYESPG